MATPKKKAQPGYTLDTFHLHPAWRRAALAEHSIQHMQGLDRRMYYAANDRWREAKQELQDAFTEAAGLILKPYFTVENLQKAWRGSLSDRSNLDRLIDHARYFNANRRPALIVTHTYKRPEGIACTPLPAGLCLVDLGVPSSWYYMTGALALGIAREGEIPVGKPIAGVGALRALRARQIAFGWNLMQGVHNG